MDANNPQLLEQHVCCACAEMPVTEEEDGCYFGPGLSAAMDSLVAQGKQQLLYSDLDLKAFDVLVQLAFEQPNTHSCTLAAN